MGTQNLMSNDEAGFLIHAVEFKLWYLPYFLEISPQQDFISRPQFGAATIQGRLTLVW